MLGIFGLFLQAAAGAYSCIWRCISKAGPSRVRSLPDRERAAFADLQKGGAAAAQARDTLIRHNLRLVAHICKKYYAGNSAQDDMISIGTDRAYQGGGYLRPRQRQALCQLCEQMY